MTELLPRPRTLVLVDDQPEFLAFARARLTRDATLAVVGEATSGEAAVALVRELVPGLEAVLVDVEMPGLDGFETARRLRALAPGVRIILTSASSNTAYCAAATGVGAQFLAKRNLTADAVLRLLDGARQ